MRNNKKKNDFYEISLFSHFFFKILKLMKNFSIIIWEFTLLFRLFMMKGISVSPIKRF